MFAFVAEFISNEGPLAQKLKWLRVVDYIIVALSYRVVNECVVTYALNASSCVVLGLGYHFGNYNISTYLLID